MNKHSIFPLSRPILCTLILILNSQFLTLNSFAQADFPLRVELECAKDQQDYKFIPLSNQGVVVFYQSALLSVDTAQWVFIHYDTNLMRKNIYKIKLPNLCQYLTADFSNDNLYLFLQKPAYKKDTLKNYLLQWNLITSSFQLFDNYKIPDKQVVYPHHNLLDQSVKTTIVGKDSLLFIGGYSNIKDKKTKGSYSGIYTMLFSNDKFSEPNIYTYGTLLSKDSTLNIKYLADPNAMMNIHITQNNGKIFAIMEIFYSEYQYNASSYRTFGYYGYDPPTQVFAGYRFLNAYIFEINSQGLLLNEWYFPIQDVLTQSLYNLVDIYQDENENTLFYYICRNTVVSQFMNGKRILSARTAIPIELANKMDILEYNSNLSMQQWYHNNFLLSGYQYIKNTHRGKGKRYVFFLNKLICE